MMSSLTVLVFCLPPDSGEKIALGVTVILAFSVFMLAIAEKMPETSESIPLVGWYFNICVSIEKVALGIPFDMTIRVFPYCDVALGFVSFSHFLQTVGNPYGFQGITEFTTSQTR